MSRSHELRMTVTDMVKYTENRIRAHMGVKSRLGVGTLSDAVKREMDAYLDTVVPRIKNPEREQIEQYEKLYDLPVAELDLSHSAEIEQASWETTKKLIEAFEDADEPEITPVQDPPITVGEGLAPPASQGDTALSDALTDYLPFIAAVAAGDAGAQRNACRDMGKMIDAVADEINDVAVEIFGDVILEEADGGYAVIEDYREQLAFLWRK